MSIPKLTAKAKSCRCDGSGSRDKCMHANAVQSLHDEQGLLELTGIACTLSLDTAELLQTSQAI